MNIYDMMQMKELMDNAKLVGEALKQIPTFGASLNLSIVKSADDDYEIGSHVTFSTSDDEDMMDISAWAAGENVEEVFTAMLEDLAEEINGESKKLQEKEEKIAALGEDTPVDDLERRIARLEKMLSSR